MASARILIIDDEHFMLEVLSQMVERFDDKLAVVTYQANSITSVELAQIIGDEKPDILIMDVDMKTANGWTVLDLMDRQPRPKVIMMSGVFGSPPVGRENQLRMQKPISWRVFKETLGNTLDINT